MIFSDLKILYEDNHLIAAVKPAGVLSQADGSASPDMLTMLKEYLKLKYNKPGAVWLGLVHRLDQPVSGVMVFARTSKAASRLSEQFRQRKTGKFYLAVVAASAPEHDYCRDYLIAADKSGKDGRVTVSGDRTHGKLAELSYMKLDQKEYGGIIYSLLAINLGSGRGHQIRAQLAARKLPIAGDLRYDPDQIKKMVRQSENAKQTSIQSYTLPFVITRDSMGRDHADLALFAARLEIEHPTLRQPLVIQDYPLEVMPWSMFDYKRLVSNLDFQQI